MVSIDYCGYRCIQRQCAHLQSQAAVASEGTRFHPHVGFYGGPAATAHDTVQWRRALTHAEQRRAMMRAYRLYAYSNASQACRKRSATRSVQREPVQRDSAFAYRWRFYHCRWRPQAHYAQSVPTVAMVSRTPPIWSAAEVAEQYAKSLAGMKAASRSSCNALPAAPSPTTRDAVYVRFRRARGRHRGGRGG
jgi:hypothetical protein